MAGENPVFDALDRAYEKRRQEEYVKATTPVVVEERPFASAAEASRYAAETPVTTEGSTERFHAEVKRADDGSWVARRTKSPLNARPPEIDPFEFAKDAAKRVYAKNPNIPREDIEAMRAWADRRRAVNVTANETAEKQPSTGYLGLSNVEKDAMAYGRTVLNISRMLGDIPKAISRNVIEPVIEAVTPLRAATDKQIEDVMGKMSKDAPVTSAVADTGGTLAGYALNPLMKVGAVARPLGPAVSGAVGFGATEAGNEFSRQLVAGESVSGRKIAAAGAQGIGTGYLIGGLGPRLEAIAQRIGGRWGQAVKGALENVALTVSPRVSAESGVDIHAPEGRDFAIATVMMAAMGGARGRGLSDQFRVDLEKRGVPPEEIKRIEIDMDAAMAEGVRQREAAKAGTTPVEAPLERPSQAPEIAPQSDVPARVAPESAAPQKPVSVDQAAPAEAPKAESIRPAPVEPPASPPTAPVEAPKGPAPEGISIKNESVNARREARGLEPLEKSAPQSEAEWNAAAEKAVAENPNKPYEVIADLKRTGRAHTPTEVAILTRHQVDLNKAYQKAADDVVAASERGDLDAVKEAKARAADISLKDLEANEVLTGSSGSEAGRSLRARQMTLAEDYSLLAMERKARVANDGKPLSEEMTAKIRDISTRMEKIQGELDALRKARAAPRTSGPVPTEPGYGKANKFVTPEAYAATRAAVREKLSRMSAGIDPTILADMVKMGAFHIEAGIRSFASWSKAMLDDLGEKAAPHLKDVWRAAQSEIGKPLMDAKATLKAAAESGKKVTDSTASIQKIAEHFVRVGVTERAELIAKVHEVLQEISPGVTYRQTMDAISGYGVFKALDKDPAKIRLRELKTEMQQIGKLEDMAGGKAPSKTGIERQAPTDDARELMRKVNEEKRKGGYERMDPERQLKTALDAIKTRLRNQIVDLEKRIATRDFKKAQRNPVPRDTKAIELEAKRDMVKREYDAALMRVEWQNKSLMQKAGALALSFPRNISRALMTAFDFSAPFRQGAILTSAHPEIASRHLGPMMKAFANKEYAAKSEAEIRLDPAYHEAKKAGLFLSEHHDAPVGKMEENVVSGVIGKIPGVGASQRAYTTFLNRLRFDVFKSGLANLSAGRTPTPTEARAWANYVNVATGRGGSPDSRLLNGLSNVFFAPRLAVSRFQVLLGTPMWRGTGATRALIAKEYARSLAGAGVFYALAKLAGGSIEDDGKVRFGGSVIDPLAGLSQAATLLKRTVPGLAAGVTGQERGKAKYGAGDEFSSLTRYLRLKLAPVPGAVTNLMTGKDAMKKPVTLGGQALSLVTPMSHRDIYKAMEMHGIPKGTALSLLSLFGMGLQHYEKKGR